MSSSNNRTQSSPSIRHRSLDRLEQLASLFMDGTWNEFSLSGHRSAVQAVQLANQFQQLHVNNDVNNIASSQATTINHSTRIPYRLENQSLTEDQLIQRLKQIIHELMSRPSRRYNYNTTIRWTVDHGNQMNYNVVILINQPAELI